MFASSTCTHVGIEMPDLRGERIGDRHRQAFNVAVVARSITLFASIWGPVNVNLNGLDASRRTTRARERKVERTLDQPLPRPPPAAWCETPCRVASG